MDTYDMLDMVVVLASCAATLYTDEQRMTDCIHCAYVCWPFVWMNGADLSHSHCFHLIPHNSNVEQDMLQVEVRNTDVDMGSSIQADMADNAIDGNSNDGSRFLHEGLTH